MSEHAPLSQSGSHLATVIGDHQAVADGGNRIFLWPKKPVPVQFPMSSGRPKIVSASNG